MGHRDLAHPLPLLAVVVLCLNDHFLKGSGLLPGWLTGKLSDFAGLFFFPILLCSAALWLSPEDQRARAEGRRGATFRPPRSPALLSPHQARSDR